MTIEAKLDAIIAKIDAPVSDVDISTKLDAIIAKIDTIQLPVPNTVNFDITSITSALATLDAKITSLANTVGVESTPAPTI